MPEQPKVEITLREIYDTQLVMKEDVHHIKTVVEKVANHDDRLTKLELRMATWTGGVMVVAVLVSPLLSLITTRLWG